MPRGGSVRPLPVVALLLVAAVAVPAGAQTTVNPGALDLLPTRPAAPGNNPANNTPTHTAPPRPRSPAVPARPAPARPANGAPATPPSAASQVAPPPPTKPVIPVVPPAIAALPPPAPVPVPRPVPVPVVPVAADAPGTASREPNRLRITFGPGREELNPTTEAALRELARFLRGNTAGVNILAYAGGSPDDPSTARRLSLQRALAARAVLINEGVASSRVYPRALGSSADADPDRVDILVQAAPQAAPP